MAAKKHGGEPVEADIGGWRMDKYTVLIADDEFWTLSVSDDMAFLGLVIVGVSVRNSDQGCRSRRDS